MICDMRLVLVVIALALLLVESGGVLRPVRTTNAAPAIPAQTRFRDAHRARPIASTIHIATQRKKLVTNA